MSEELFFVLLLGGLMGVLIWGLAKQTNQIEESKQRLCKLAEQAGGRDVVVWREQKLGQKGFYEFVVIYVDVNRNKQKHRVTQHWEVWGGLSKEFFWDRPLQLANTAPRVSSSKEQIISEMDAEIKRLQEELRRTREES